jgi:hypothetical protein
VFRVNVPKDWDAKRRLVWTLTANGQTNYAKGILLPEFELNPGVIAAHVIRAKVSDGNLTTTHDIRVTVTAR